MRREIKADAWKLRGVDYKMRRIKKEMSEKSTRQIWFSLKLDKRQFQQIVNRIFTNDKIQGKLLRLRNFNNDIVRYC